MQYVIKGNVVDVHQSRIYPAEIKIREDRIVCITEVSELFDDYILPGLIDAHIHIESSMLTPSAFANLAVRHGTVAVVADPHEIANVSGMEGVDFMITNGQTVPLKFFFGAPSCVPATEFESSGGRINPEDVKKLLMRDDIYFLSEMMNFPGVINNDEGILEKIKYAEEFKKPVDGHAPGLSGEGMVKYIKAGITTDHECLSLQEAEEKVAAGMKIQIREGSAAKGFDMLCALIDKFPDRVMLCSDDMHPDDLIDGHINKLLFRGIRKGINIFNLIRAATINPILHYNLPAGMLREGDFADIVIIRNLDSFEVKETIINGKKVFSEGKVFFENNDCRFTKKFRTTHISPEEIRLKADGSKIRVIESIDGELYTHLMIRNANIIDGYAVSDPQNDICKIVVVNKYSDARPAIGFISGFGLKNGAIAGSVAHDSHNIISAGTDDYQIADAINTILDMKGGLTAVSSGRKLKLQLEIAGLMTNLDGYEVAKRYKEIDNFAKLAGSSLSAPFMTLSFMSLLVIPELKIGDKGLFDVNKFEFTPLFLD